MEKERGYCRRCGAGWPDKKLSNRGLCPGCRTELWLAAISQMEAKAGPIYEKWRVNYIAAMSGVLNRLRKELEQDDLPF